MSRIIEGKELQSIQFAIDMAVEAAKGSTCGRDHRGSAVFKEKEILGFGSNGPILPFKCEPEKCGDVCGIYAMHAERMAIINALENKRDLTGASVLHVRINEADEVQVSGNSRCEDCTNYMRRVGRNKKRMKLADFILLQEKGWTAYKIEEADVKTRKNLNLF